MTPLPRSQNRLEAAMRYSHLSVLRNVPEQTGLMWQAGVALFQTKKQYGHCGLKRSHHGETGDADANVTELRLEPGNDEIMARRCG
jgi:hypothetical protein